MILHKALEILELMTQTPMNAVCHSKMSTINPVTKAIKYWSDLGIDKGRSSSARTYMYGFIKPKNEHNYKRKFVSEVKLQIERYYVERYYSFLKLDLRESNSDLYKFSQYKPYLNGKNW